MQRRINLTLIIALFFVQILSFVHLEKHGIFEHGKLHSCEISQALDNVRFSDLAKPVSLVALNLFHFTDSFVEKTFTITQTFQPFNSRAPPFIS